MLASLFLTMCRLQAKLTVTQFIGFHVHHTVTLIKIVDFLYVQVVLVMLSVVLMVHVVDLVILWLQLLMLLQCCVVVIADVVVMVLRLLFLVSL